MYSKYYYLAASLPYLILGKAQPLAKEDFLSECKKWLSASDFSRLESIDIESLDITANDLPLLAGWKRFDMSLRTELADFRKKRRKEKERPAPASLKDIFEKENPLLMERAIAQKRWNFIEECEFGNHFDLNFLTLYFLKLQILERITKFDKEKGRDIFQGYTRGKI
ncbi:MAG: DUF2764 family protein [Candidatus Omnitrophota bacterium]